MIVIGHKGFSHVGLFIVTVLLARIASDCALYHSYEASRPGTVRKTEARLTDAGFTTIKVDTSDKSPQQIDA